MADASGDVRTPKPALWTGRAPLVLASRSASRLALLAASGLTVESVAPDVDERAEEARHFAAGGAVGDLACALARAKALAVSAARPDAWCIGADQTLTVEGRLLHKARDRREAAQSLAALAGRTHRLTSAVCVARGGAALLVTEDTAELDMRPLDDETIGRYLDLAGPAVLSSVGVYQLEALGAHLFERIRGDHFTILGLPLLALLAWARAEGLLSL
ncbi:septum formation protein [Roseiarcus fermentans]|uniref:Nucleoside triphosphate pyrophosphatase n=1 Tax=Roseiarcus fermentans TaxID=1473586 RepID=A0A366FP22_9HYPH|nr:Maf family protein [Roseiarcus fermentans]RBP16378.1 septum formation protein [Roseiarcus fermentans]